MKHLKNLSYTLHIQLQQILNLFLLLVLAKYTAFLSYGWDKIIIVLILTLAMAYLLHYIQQRTILPYIPYSALTTALGVLLMSFATHLWITIVVIFIALVQKHFLRIENRHIFNPSNFALIFGLFFFYSDFHIVLGQLGDSLYLATLVLFLGSIILYRIERWIISIAFAIFYLLCQYFIIIQTDPVMEMENILLRFYSVSFILFVLFMLTDPKTTPAQPLRQIFFAGTLALVATILDYTNGFRVQHLFMALFIISASLPLFSHIRSSDKKRYLVWCIFVLAMGAIILIELRPPYYFAMDV